MINKQVQQDNGPICYPLTIIQYKNAVYYGQVNSRGCPHQVGLYFYDNGNVALYQLEQGRKSGHFLYFRDEKGGNSCMFYGSMKNGKLHGLNYAYSHRQAYLKVNFFNGQPQDDQDLRMRSHFREFRIFNDENKLKRQTIQESAFIKPTDFIQEYFCPSSPSYSFNNEKSVNDLGKKLAIYQIGEKQLYFGTVREGKPHGYGIMFVGEWPMCYGLFQSGQLDGLARVRQTSYKVIDGFFQTSHLISGWILDIRNNTTSFGQKSRGKFEIHSSHKGIQIEKVEHFRKACHLLSLPYNNNYILDVEPHNMWPKYLLDQIMHDQIIQDILSNYNPAHLSEIERVAEITDHTVQKDLIDLISEHREKKYQHQAVSKILQKRLKEFKEEDDSTLKKVFPLDDRKRLEHLQKTSSHKNLDLRKIYQTYLKK